MIEQEIILELYKKEKKEAIFTCIVSLCGIVIAMNVFYTYENVANGIIVFVIASLVCVLAILTSMSDFLKLRKRVKKQTYTYYYLDIERYFYGLGGLKATYNLRGRQYVRTNIRGAKKVHVFDCGDQHLTMIEMPDADNIKKETM